MTWGVADLTVRFGRRRALDGVTLEVAPGEVAAVIGGDGAGKTTLVRVLAGVLAPTSGAVRRPAAERIGYLAATSGTYPDLTVDENLAFAATAYGLDPRVARERATELLERTGLDTARDRLAGRLSGGMRQKLGVVQALQHRPDLLVLDEPSTGVDPVSRADLWRLIAGAAGEGTAVVFTTSYGDEARRAGRVLALDAGRIGDPAEWERTPPVAGTGAGRGGDPAPGPELAVAEGVVRRYGPVAAVDGVDLRLAGGEVVGLLGANGAGKTTLIRLLLGLELPTAGRVALFGEPPSRRTRRRLGYVPQSLGLYDDLTAAENLAFAAAVFGEQRAAAEVPDLPELDDPDLAGVTVGRLPLGVQRRVAVAQALAHAPDLLVLDEPTSGVDPRARAQLWATIRSAADAGAGALVTTHHLEEAEECDRLVLMVAGRVVAEGTVADIVGGSTLEERFVELASAPR